MKTVFVHEFKSNFRSILTWSFSMLLLTVFFLSIYPAYTNGAEEFKKITEGFPPVVLKALNIDVDLIFSPVGFYAFIFTYLVLCGAIHAMILGTRVIAKEFTRKTADFLFTKPVSRYNIMTGKLLAGVLSVAVTDIFVIGLTYLAARVFIEKPLDLKLYFMISATLFFISLIFFVIGFLVAVIFQRIKSVIGVSIGTVFGFFVAGMLGLALNDEKIKYLVPFQYYDPMKIIREASYEPVFIVLSALIVLIGILASYLIYTKRDIHAV